MIRSAALLFVLILAATPAAAHWDPTRWGMTPEAVKALYPSLEPSGAPEYRDPARPVLGFPTPYVFEGQSFSMARLFFRTGTLDSVELATDRKANQLPGLIAWLERRHGKPLATNGSMTVPAGGSMAFYDADYAGADGDRVKLVVMVWPNGDALSAVSWKPPSG